MAYDSKNLSVLAYANGFKLWHYTTVDFADDLNTAGYFNDAAGVLRVGDLVIINTDTDDVISGGTLLIAGNDASKVDVVSMIVAPQ